MSTNSDSFHTTRAYLEAWVNNKHQWYGCSSHALSYLKQIIPKDWHSSPVSEEKEKASSPLQKLTSLSGLEEIKDKVQKAYTFPKMQNRRQAAGLPAKPYSLHQVFTGNHGTGKSTVARLLGELYAEHGLLGKGHTVGVGYSDLVGKYTGHSASLVKTAFNAALDGVLFIDDAYLLGQNSASGFEQEAIKTLLQLMESHQGRVAVIMAGYTASMQGFIASDPRLQAHFSQSIHFEDYSLTTLAAILKRQLAAQHLQYDAGVWEAIVWQLAAIDSNRGEYFGNIHVVQNFTGQIMAQQAIRLESLESNDMTNSHELLPADIPLLLPQGKASAIPAHHCSLDESLALFKDLAKSWHLTLNIGAENQLQTLLADIQGQEGTHSGTAQGIHNFFHAVVGAQSLRLAENPEAPPLLVTAQDLNKEALIAAMGIKVELSEKQKIVEAFYRFMDANLRPASFGLIFNIPPANYAGMSLTSLWQGGGFVGKPGETYPKEEGYGRTTGDFMPPLLQIIVDELPFVPEKLKNIKAITLFGDKYSPLDRVIRAYSHTDELVTLPIPRGHEDFSKGWPVGWHLHDRNAMCVEMLYSTEDEAVRRLCGQNGYWFDFDLDVYWQYTGGETLYYLLDRCRSPNRHSIYFQVGGWPHYIQYSRPKLDQDFVLQTYGPADLYHFFYLHDDGTWTIESDNT